MKTQEEETKELLEFSKEELVRMILNYKEYLYQAILLWDIDKFKIKEEITITKEQILSLGWKEWGEIDGKSFYKKDIFLRTYIGYINNKIESFIISIYNEEGIKFKGNCFSIEDLKFICKLLNI